MLAAILAALGLGTFASAQQAISQSSSGTKPQAEPAPAQKDLPKARDIIERAVEAMGGRAAFDAVKSVHVSATMTGGPEGATSDLFSAGREQILLRQGLPNFGQVETGQNGPYMWTKMPGGRYRLLTKEQMIMRAEQARLFWLVPDLQATYETIQTVDRVELADQECYKIKLADRKDIASVQDDRSVRFIYFSVSSGLLVGLETYPAGLERAGIITLFRQWKEFKEPKLTLFTEFQSGQDGRNTRTLLFNEVEFNEVDEAVFAVPEEVKALFAEQQAKEAARKNAPAPPDSSPEGVGAEGQGKDPGSGDVDPELAQFTERERQQIQKTLSAFERQTNPAQLRMIVGILKGQLGNAQTERDKAILEYVLKKLEQRLESLESGK
jgi:hypothetical protein